MKSKLIYCLYFALAISVNGCRKKPPIVYVTTLDIGTITNSTVVSGGLLAGSGVTDKGLCWAKHENPTIDDNRVSVGEGASQFTVMAEGLEQGTRYYIRAYATNVSGTGYGEVKSFNTVNIINGNVQTTNVQRVTETEISCVVQSTNTLQNIEEVGVCYSKHPNPTLNDSRAKTSISFLPYSVNINGLEAGTVYYVRAYILQTGAINYGNILKVNTYSQPVTDINGNTYKTIKIGNQTWMAENLRVTSYNDGTSIDYIQSQSAQWGVWASGAYGYYGGSTFYQSRYGNLYNMNTFTGIRDIAPLGWHIPTKAEFDTLFNYLQNNTSTIYKLMLNSSFWLGGSSTQANNESGFSALPGGARTFNGFDSYEGSRAYFWTKTPVGNTCYAIILNPGGAQSIEVSQNVAASSGLSIRCIKN